MPRFTNIPKTTTTDRGHSKKWPSSTRKSLEVGTEQFCILAYSYVGDWLQRSDWTQGWGSGGALPDGKPHAVPLMGWRNEEE
jgi:hypothetical protein